MSHITICGTAPLRGEVSIQRAKNSVLPILAATLLHRGSCRIECCPHLSDVEAAADILQHLGCRVYREGTDLVVDASTVTRCDIPRHLMSRFRSSMIFLGAILARCGEATLSYPGGCELGARPIDLHLAALGALGTQIEDIGGTLHCRAPHLKGQEILLSIPSVGATENAMLAASASEGTTIISNAAREPEIVDLQCFLQKLGVRIHGAGSSIIVIRGGDNLHEWSHRCIPDRIVTATYLCAGAACGGEITLHDTDYRHLTPVTTALQQAGCRLQCSDDTITLSSRGKLKALPPVRTYPHPGFPTDAQPPLMAALLRAEGTTMFVENIFENRYRHGAELMRMGADIRLEGRVAVVCGVEKLHGAAVGATDLRGGAALVIAALQAEGTTQIENIHHILRGYEDIVGDLHSLGADIHLET